jgi:hypothetical protein
VNQSRFDFSELEILRTRPGIGLPVSLCVELELEPKIEFLIKIFFLEKINRLEV